MGLSTSDSARDGQFEVLHSTFHFDSLLHKSSRPSKNSFFLKKINKDIFQGGGLLPGSGYSSEMCNGPFFLRYRIVAVGNLISPNE